MSDDVRAVLSGEARFACAEADCIAFLEGLPDQSVDLVLGSPPYELARVYFEAGADLGIARDTEAWCAWMVRVVKASLRVCRGLVCFVVEGQTKDYRYSCGPVLLMADLHRAGVHLRKPPAYRRVGIPGSGGPDWLRNDYEFCVCATNGGRLPWSDNTACGHTPKWAPGGEMSHRLTDGQRVNAGVNEFGMTGREHARSDGRVAKEQGRFSKKHTKAKANGADEQQSYTPPVLANPGNVIDVKVGGGQMGHPLCHDNEAPYPEALAEFFVRSFCPPGGIVLDPYSGSGTTAAVAVALGRRALCCDMRASQVDLTRRRVGLVTPQLPGIEG